MKSAQYSIKGTLKIFWCHNEALLVTIAPFGFHVCKHFHAFLLVAEQQQDNLQVLRSHLSRGLSCMGLRHKHSGDGFLLLPLEFLQFEIESFLGSVTQLSHFLTLCDTHWFKARAS